MKSGKYWLDVETKRLSEINESITGSDGQPWPPMDCILVQVDIINDYGTLAEPDSSARPHKPSESEVS